MFDELMQQATEDSPVGYYEVFSNILNDKIEKKCEKNKDDDADDNK